MTAAQAIRVAALAVTVSCCAAGSARAELIDVPATPLSSSEAKRVCPDWARPDPDYVEKGTKCEVEWEWLDDGRRLSRVRYVWPYDGARRGKRFYFPNATYHIEVLFEELPNDEARALMGLKGNGIDSHATNFGAVAVDGRILVGVSDCLNGKLGCPGDYEYEWQPGGRLIAIHIYDLIEPEVVARLRQGYKILECSIDEQKMTALCGVCRVDDEDCCPGGEVSAKLKYVSGEGIRVEAMRREDYDKCDPLDCECRD